MFPRRGLALELSRSCTEVSSESRLLWYSSSVGRLRVATTGNAMDVKPGDIVGDKYRLERPLASGGMGAVWVATHQHLDTAVAVKFMAADCVHDASSRRRFDREAKASATLRSQHVVQVFDYGYDKGRRYIVMELLDGEDLRSFIRRRGKLSLRTAHVIFNQMCKALQIAADSDIVHRDLKPSNVFLARSGDERVVKVLDFGLVKALGTAKLGEETESGTIIGTPHYMSPEQARDSGKIDSRSDLWSAAVILFEMLTGCRPIDGNELGDVLFRLFTEPMPLPSEFDKTIPSAVDQFFERAFDQRSQKRFDTAREMAGAFSEVVGQVLNLSSPVLSLAGELKADSEHPGPDVSRVDDLSTESDQAPIAEPTVATRMLESPDPGDVDRSREGAPAAPASGRTSTTVRIPVDKNGPGMAMEAVQLSVASPTKGGALRRLAAWWPAVPVGLAVLFALLWWMPSSNTSPTSGSTSSAAATNTKSTADGWNVGSDETSKGTSSLNGATGLAATASADAGTVDTPPTAAPADGTAAASASSRARVVSPKRRGQVTPAEPPSAAPTTSSPETPIRNERLGI